MDVSRGFSRELLVRGPIVLLLGALCTSIGAAPAAQQQPPAVSPPPAGQPPPAGSTPQAGQQPPAGGRAGGRGNAAASLFTTTARPVTAPTSPAAARRRSSPNACWPRTTTTRSSRRSGTACRTRRWCRSRARSTSSRSGSSWPTSVRSGEPEGQAGLRPRSEQPDHQVREADVPDRSRRAGARDAVGPGVPARRPPARHRASRAPAHHRQGQAPAGAVKGTPKVWERQDSGMLDVAIHPQYAKNGWIYLAYTEVVPGYVAPPPAPAAPPADPRRPPARGGGVEAGRPVRRR